MNEKVAIAEDVTKKVEELCRKVDKEIVRLLSLSKQESKKTINQYQSQGETL